LVAIDEQGVAALRLTEEEGENLVQLWRWDAVIKEVQWRKLVAESLTAICGPSPLSSGI